MSLLRFDLLSKGLALADFEWRDETNDDESSRFSSLHHLPTGAHISFDTMTGGESTYWVTWWPTFTGGKPYTSFASWTTVLPFADRWLAAVALEHETADLWMTAKLERAWLTEVPSATVNSPFTQTERELIREHLSTIEAYVATTYQLTKEQHAEVQAHFAYLSEATERLGRFDWRGLAASTFISVVLQLGLTPDRAAGFMNLVTQLLSPLLSGVARLLSGT